MTQFAYPTSDVSTSGTWVNQASGSTNLYQSIDEVSASDSDYVRAFSSNAAYTAGLGSVTDPMVSTGHVIHARLRMSASETMSVALMQGATTIASFSPSLTTTFADYTYTLSGAEADSITNYSDLRLKFTRTTTSGSNSVYVSQAYLETPDVVSLVTVSATRAVPYVVNAAISTTRRVPYAVTGQVNTTRRIPYGIAGVVAATRRVPYTVLTTISTTRRTPWVVKILAAASRALPYVVKQQAATTRRVPYTVTGIVAAQRAIVYQVRTAPAAERRLPFKVTGLVEVTRRLLWKTLSGTTFTLTDDFIDQAGALSVAYGQPLKQFTFGGLTIFTTNDEELIAALRLLAEENEGVLIEGLPG